MFWIYFVQVRKVEIIQTLLTQSTEARKMINQKLGCPKSPWETAWEANQADILMTFVNSG